MQSKLISEHPAGTDAEMLQRLQQQTFDYFLDNELSVNGLVADKTQPGSAASITVMGLALSSFPVGVEREFITIDEAVARTLDTFRFLARSHQGPEPDATGYKGFYYHFLDMTSGKRAFTCELSTIDTAVLMAGVLTALHYYTDDTPGQNEIRELSDMLYRRVDWQWALNGKTTLTHGWKPEKGFLRYRWNKRYNEAHILYVLALGSPTFPIAKVGYTEWIKTFEWMKHYELEYLYAGPLFIHQIPQMWLDMNGIQDEFMREHDIDYFENSRRATHVQRQYAIDNPRGFDHYDKNCWGITASDGPGPATLKINGVKRKFYDYRARGVPFGPDDGTITPWGVVASLPFAPEIVLESIRNSIEGLDLIKQKDHGFYASFNPTYPSKKENQMGWVSPFQFGLNQGPVVLMIENYRTGLLWHIFRKCAYVVDGLRAAGFSGGWLEDQKR